MAETPATDWKLCRHDLKEPRLMGAIDPIKSIDLTLMPKENARKAPIVIELRRIIAISPLSIVVKCCGAILMVVKAAIWSHARAKNNGSGDKKRSESGVEDAISGNKSLVRRSRKAAILSDGFNTVGVL